MSSLRPSVPDDIVDALSSESRVGRRVPDVGMSGKGTVRIGTSGWQYDHWRGPFYPDDLPRSKWLGHYAERLRTVEVNGTFYGSVEDDTVALWRRAVPEGFVFAVKAHRYITHQKKLKDPEASLARFLETLEAFGDALGPVLYQLPPRWQANGRRLDEFLRALPKRFHHVFEFRDPTWFTEDIKRVLEAHDAVFCIYELAGFRSPRWITSDRLVYVRLHGPGDAYQGCYDADELDRWAEAAEAWAQKGKDVYVYFDNDQGGYAAINARELQERVRDCAGRA